MILVTPCDSLSTMVKQSGLIRCSVEWLCWCIGDVSLNCYLSQSQKDLPDSPIYSHEQLMCQPLNLYITPLFCNLFSLSLGAIRRVLMVPVPLKCTWIPKLLHVIFNLSYASPSLSISILPPNTPNTPCTPYTPISVAPCLVSMHLYSCSLTFSHRPDEVASIWRLQKLVCYKLDNFALFQHLGRYLTQWKPKFEL